MSDFMYAYICTYVCVFIYAYMYMYVCYVCVFAYLCVYICFDFGEQLGTSYSIKLSVQGEEKIKRADFLTPHTKLLKKEKFPFRQYV